MPAGGARISRSKRRFLLKCVLPPSWRGDLGASFSVGIVGIVTNWNDMEKILHHTFHNDDFTIAADSFAVVRVFKRKLHKGGKSRNGPEVSARREQESDGCRQTAVDIDHWSMSGESEEPGAARRRRPRLL